MKRAEQTMRELLRRARGAHRSGDTPPPPPSPAFVARVVREWTRLSPETSVIRLWERYAIRSAVASLGLAVAVCLTVWATWVPLPPDPTGGWFMALSEIVFLP